MFWLKWREEGILLLSMVAGGQVRKNNAGCNLPRISASFMITSYSITCTERKKVTVHVTVCTSG